MPFFDSLTSELSIPDTFSLQLCGTDTSSWNESSDIVDGLLVINYLSFVMVLIKCHLCVSEILLLVLDVRMQVYCTPYAVLTVLFWS